MGVKSKGGGGGGTQTRECGGKMVRGERKTERKQGARRRRRKCEADEGSRGVGPGARECFSDERIPVSLRPSPG